jgi:hypothetical protein
MRLSLRSHAKLAMSIGFCGLGAAIVFLLWLGASSPSVLQPAASASSTTSTDAYPAWWSEEWKRYPVCDDSTRGFEPCMERQATPESLPECSERDTLGDRQATAGTEPPKIDPATGHPKGACGSPWVLRVPDNDTKTGINKESVPRARH